jgi:uncharacterized protein
MKRNWWIAGGAAVAVVVAVSLMGGPDREAYAREVEERRAEKLKFLKNSSESPFVQFKVPLGELSWYPVDMDYRVTAKVERMETAQYQVVRKSDGSTERYLRYAWLSFKWQGEQQKLLVLKRPFGPGLFLAFADATSGDTTYGGGRYLDLLELKGDRVTLDFNLAYNPYCAYVAEYQCPFPPAENVLKIKVEAGEMDYGK